MKKYALLIVFGFLVYAGCNKEEPQETSADFSTNIEGGTLAEDEEFVLYLNRVEGEFATYFHGGNQNNIYDANDATRKGKAIDVSKDSLVIDGYEINADTLVFNGEEHVNDTTDGVVSKNVQFTLVASSFGNWSEDSKKEVKSMRITVTKELEE